jgi:hypothetical protein
MAGVGGFSRNGVYVVVPVFYCLGFERHIYSKRTVFLIHPLSNAWPMKNKEQLHTGRTSKIAYMSHLFNILNYYYYYYYFLVLSIFFKFIKT